MQGLSGNDQLNTHTWCKHTEDRVAANTAMYPLSLALRPQGSRTTKRALDFCDPRPSPGMALVKTKNRTASLRGIMSFRRPHGTPTNFSKTGAQDDWPLAQSL